MKIEQGFQVPFATEVRDKTDIATMAVGFLWDPKICDALLSQGQADMVALAREVLDDPNWPLNAARQSTGDGDFGWWLMKRDRLVRKLGLQ